MQRDFGFILPGNRYAISFFITPWFFEIRLETEQRQLWRKRIQRT